MQAFFFKNIMKIVRTTSENPDFIRLTKLLDEFLADYNGEADPFYSEFKKIQLLEYCIVGYEKDEPVCCGAIKKYDGKTAEIKRMFTLPEWRGRKLGNETLSELENWAKELEFEVCFLETGVGLKSAIKLYESSGYEKIPNYGDYAGVETSVCFRKKL